MKIIVHEFATNYLIDQELLPKFYEDIDLMMQYDYAEAFLDFCHEFDKRWDKYKLERVTED